MILLFFLLQAAELKPVTHSSEKIMSETVALKYIKNKTILLRMSLRGCKDPRVEASRIKKQENEILWFAQLPADSKLNFKSCNAESPFMSQYLLLYCKKTRTLHEIHSFYPVTGKMPELSAPVADCKSFVRI